MASLSAAANKRKSDDGERRDIKISRTNGNDEESPENINCIVCFEILSGRNPKRYPTNLFCGHANLCNLCAGEMVNGQNKIQCPQCSKVTTGCDPTNIPVNITLKTLLEERENKVIAASTQAKSLTSFQALSSSLSVTDFSCDRMCQNTNDDDEPCPNFAEVYCQSCDLSFCKICREDTHRPKFLRNHQFLPSESRTPMCPIHPLYPLDKV
jgi:hypothetical protein